MERLPSFFTWTAIAITTLLGCSSDTSAHRICPPDFPVERDGMCFADDGDAGPGGMDAGGGDVDAGGGDVDSGGGDVDSGGGDVDSGGGDVDAGLPGIDAGPPVCMGTHPRVEGTRRFCDPGACYCADPDACFSIATADACCPGPVVCASTSMDAGTVACTPSHPRVEGTRRFCDPGFCYCADPDSCHPAATADACCPGPTVCY